MARMHVLQRSSGNVFNVVVHTPTPVGNNQAGVSWATAIQNAGLARTSMAIGNGPGQITAAEENQVTNGTVIETTFRWEDNPAWTNPERLADLNTRAGQAVAEALAGYQALLLQYGRTVT